MGPVALPKRDRSLRYTVYGVIPRDEESRRQSRESRHTEDVSFRRTYRRNLVVSRGESGTTRFLACGLGMTPAGYHGTQHGAFTLSRHGV
jgi:hypothetical protein